MSHIINGEQESKYDFFLLVSSPKKRQAVFVPSVHPHPGNTELAEQFKFSRKWGFQKGIKFLWVWQEWTYTEATVTLGHTMKEGKHHKLYFSREKKRVYLRANSLLFLSYEIQIRSQYPQHKNLFTISILEPGKGYKKHKLRCFRLTILDNNLLRTVSCTFFCPCQGTGQIFMTSALLHGGALKLVIIAFSHQFQMPMSVLDVKKHLGDFHRSWVYLVPPKGLSAAPAVRPSVEKPFLVLMDEALNQWGCTERQAN